MKKLILILGLLFISQSFAIELKVAEDKKKQQEEFFHAVFKNDIKKVQEILKSKNVDINAENNRGWTALMSACIFDDLQLAKILIENGADINAKDSGGWTALMRAGSKTLKLLIKNGANINTRLKNINASVSIFDIYKDKDYNFNKEIIILLNKWKSYLIAYDKEKTTGFEDFYKKRKYETTIIGQAHLPSHDISSIVEDYLRPAPTFEQWIHFFHPEMSKEFDNDFAEVLNKPSQNELLSSSSSSSNSSSSSSSSSSSLSK